MDSTTRPRVVEQPVARGGKEGFVAKLAPNGSAFRTSTYVGGLLDDEPFDLAIGGDVFVVGHTTSSDLPTRNALQPAYRGARDLFVAKIARSGPSASGRDSTASG